jgi:orotate phosphoribosyltransferase
VSTGQVGSGRSGDDVLDATRARVAQVVLEHGVRHFDEAVQLASGAWSHDFVDAKRALARGGDLELACRALVDLVADLDFDVVGGLTMGADQFAHGIAMVTGTEWFVVRKEPKGRGTNQLVEGAAVGPGRRALVVEDVATSGGSLRKAVDEVLRQGAEVVAAVVLIDRGEMARACFDDLELPYRALLTYRDLGIAPLEPSTT